MSHDPNAPFYKRHKVVALTCPHCCGRLVFMTNTADRTVYTCTCGRWFKRLDWSLDGKGMTDRKLWNYERTIINHERKSDTQ